VEIGFSLSREGVLIMKFKLMNKTEEDIDPNQADCFWQVLSTIEASDEEKKKAIQWLIDEGKDLNATFGEEGNTALHTIFARENGATDAEKRLQLLFSFTKIDVNAKNNKGQTPLVYAMTMILEALDSELNIDTPELYNVPTAAFLTLLAHKNIDVNQQEKEGQHFLMKIFHQLKDFFEDETHEWTPQARKYLKLEMEWLGKIFERKGKDLIWTGDQENKDTFLHHAIRLLYLSPPVGDITSSSDRLIFSVLTGDPDYSAKNSDDKTPLELLEMYVRLYKKNPYQRSKFQLEHLNKHATDIKSSYLPNFEKTLFSDTHQYRNAKAAHLASEEGVSIDLNNLFMKLHVYLCDKSRTEKGDYAGRLLDFSSLYNELIGQSSQETIKKHLSNASAFTGKKRNIFRHNHYHNLRKELLKLSQQELETSFNEYKTYLEFIRDHQNEFRLVGRRPAEVDICQKILKPTVSLSYQS